MGLVENRERFKLVENVTDGVGNDKRRRKPNSAFCCFFGHYIHLEDTCWVFLIFLALSCYFLGTGVFFVVVAMAAISSSAAIAAARATFPGVAWCVGVSHSVMVIHTVWCMAA